MPTIKVYSPNEEKQLMKDIIAQLHTNSGDVLYPEVKIQLEAAYFSDPSLSRMPSIIWKLGQKLSDDCQPFRLLDWNVEFNPPNYEIRFTFRTINLKDLSGDSLTLVGRAKSWDDILP